MNPVIGEIVLGIYAVHLAVGGALGYVKAGSRPSLIAGLASALLSAIAAGLIALLDDPRPGLILGILVSVALVVVFARRLRATGKFMPSGVLAAVSLVVLTLLIVILSGVGS